MNVTSDYLFGATNCFKTNGLEFEDSGESIESGLGINDYWGYLQLSSLSHWGYINSGISSLEEDFGLRALMISLEIPIS